MAEEQKGRVGVQIYLPVAEIGTVDRAVAMSGKSRSTYIGELVVAQAKLDCAAADRRERRR